MAKNSPYKSSYMKERRRVQRLVNRYKKVGLETNIIIPKIPKRITQGSINRLSKITPEKVSRATFAPHPETGEVVSVFSLRKMGIAIKSLPQNIFKGFEVQARNKIGKSLVDLISNYRDTREAELPDYEVIIIDNFLSDISSFPDASREILLSWFNQLRSSVNDDEKIADMLEEAKKAGVMPSIGSAYNTEQLMSNLSDMFNLLDISGGEKNVILEDLDIASESFW